MDGGTEVFEKVEEGPETVLKSKSRSDAIGGLSELESEEREAVAFILGGVGEVGEGAEKFEEEPEPVSGLPG